MFPAIIFRRGEVDGYFSVERLTPLRFDPANAVCGPLSISIHSRIVRSCRSAAARYGRNSER